MADIDVNVPSMEGYTDATFGPTSPAGDTILWTGDSVVVEFRNNHNADIDITFSPSVVSVRVIGVGIIMVPARTYTIEPGEEAAFLFERRYSSAYVGQAMRLPISYTGGNANLKVRALGVSARSGTGGVFIDDRGMDISNFVDDLGRRLSQFTDDLGRRI